MRGEEKVDLLLRVLPQEVKENRVRDDAAAGGGGWRETKTKRGPAHGTCVRVSVNHIIYRHRKSADPLFPLGSAFASKLPLLLSSSVMARASLFFAALLAVSTGCLAFTAVPSAASIRAVGSTQVSNACT